MGFHELQWATTKMEMDFVKQTTDTGTGQGESKAGAGERRRGAGPDPSLGTHTLGVILLFPYSNMFIQEKLD